MSTQLILRVVGGFFGDLTQADLRGMVYSIDAPQSLTVGRSETGTDVVVRSDARMSGQHFRIAFEDNAWCISDLESKHGTYVAGEVVDAAELRDGCMVRAGETTFRINILSSSSRAGITNASAAESPAESVGLLGAATGLPALHGLSTSGDGRDTVEFADPIQVVIRVQSGPFEKAEAANLLRLLNWLGPGESLVVGRTYEADMVVRQDERISARHFEIACNTTTARLRDLGSSNGTLVRGFAVQETMLAHGDEIIAGDTSFKISIMGGPQAPGAGLEQTETFAELQPSQRDTASVLPHSSGSAPFPPLQVILNIVSGPFSEERKQELSALVTWFGAGETVVVGRSSSKANMRISADGKLSDRHFEVLCDGWDCRLRDLDSEHGTRLNGQPVREASLHDGDTILAGETSFQVKIKGGPAGSDKDTEPFTPKP